jgi:hypothetical protein
VSAASGGGSGGGAVDLVSLLALMLCALGIWRFARHAP